MDTKNSNRVNMIDATTGVCDANTSATSGIAKFALRLADVKTKKVLINALNQIGMGNTKGVTNDTNLLRLTMRKIAMKCANATIAFANSEKNSTLLQTVNFNKSKLDKLSKSDIDDACQAIHDAANDNIADVVDFGIVAGDVTDLATAISVYRVAAQNPRQARITKGEAIRDAKRLVREIIHDLFEGQMDKMVNTLEETENTFWRQYFSARNIMDLGTTFAKVRGTVLDMLDEPLEGVKFTMLDASTKEVMKEVLTDSDGKFKTGKVGIGDFDFMWELNGYISKVEPNVHIAAGKELRRKVALKKGGGSAVREGDVPSPGIVNVNLNGIKGQPGTMVKIEATGSGLRFYGADTVSSVPGAKFIDVMAGQSVTKTVEEVMAETGLDEKDLLNVQNIGMTQGHYKITFMNLGEF